VVAACAAYLPVFLSIFALFVRKLPITLRTNGAPNNSPKLGLTNPAELSNRKLHQERANLPQQSLKSRPEASAFRGRAARFASTSQEIERLTSRSTSQESCISRDNAGETPDSSLLA
jgi:hypothetical protein